MVAHGVYAQIFDETVQNIMVCDDYELANLITRASYGDDGFAVDCLQYPCAIGDRYRDGKFFRVVEGEEIPIPYIPTQEEQVAALNGENTSLKGQVTDLQLALTEQYEENLALQEEVTTTQLALTELYEEMEVQKMAKVYADLIRKGLKTIEQVPEKLRAEVEELLNVQAAAYLIFMQEGGGGDGSYLCDTDN